MKQPAPVNSNLSAQAWAQAPKQVDPNFSGSLYEQLGFQKELCPVCNRHLKDDLCLDGCHLGPEHKEILNRIFDAALRSFRHGCSDVQ